MSEEQRNPTVVCVLGTHRSGTSLTARLVSLLGVYLGPKERLVGASSANPRGFWEHRDMQRLDREIFLRFGGTWRDPPLFPRGWVRSTQVADLRQHALD